MVVLIDCNINIGSVGNLCLQNGRGRNISYPRDQIRSNDNSMKCSRIVCLSVKRKLARLCVNVSQMALLGSKDLGSMFPQTNATSTTTTMLATTPSVAEDSVTSTS